LAGVLSVVDGVVGAALASGAALRGRGNKIWGKVARLRAAGSVGKYRLPRWPHADKAMNAITKLITIAPF
jgi:hypothetical protein